MEKNYIKYKSYGKMQSIDDRNGRNKKNNEECSR